MNRKPSGVESARMTNGKGQVHPCMYAPYKFVKRDENVRLQGVSRTAAELYTDLLDELHSERLEDIFPELVPSPTFKDALRPFPSLSLRSEYEYFLLVPWGFTIGESDPTLLHGILDARIRELVDDVGLPLLFGAIRPSFYFDLVVVIIIEGPIVVEFLRRRCFLEVRQRNVVKEINEISSMVRNATRGSFLVEYVSPDVTPTSLSFGIVGNDLCGPCHTGIIDELKNPIDDLVFRSASVDFESAEETAGLGEGLSNCL